jgi:hypothetical protein
MAIGADAHSGRFTQQELIDFILPTAVGLDRIRDRFAEDLARINSLQNRMMSVGSSITPTISEGERRELEREYAELKRALATHSERTKARIAQTIATEHPRLSRVARTMRNEARADSERADYLTRHPPCTLKDATPWHAPTAGAFVTPDEEARSSAALYRNLRTRLSRLLQPMPS